MEKEHYELKIDSDFERIIPPLQSTELTLLKESILSNGCEMPLVVWNRTVVDGHNRYRICHENGIPFAIEEKQFESRDAAKIWLIKNQLGRRNLPDFQKCELVLPLEELLKAEAEKERRKAISDFRRENETVPNLAPSHSKTRDTLAAMAGISHGTLDKAKKIMESADDETKDLLRRGKMSIHKAYTELKREKPQESVLAADPEKQETVSLLKKPVFAHYEPAAYMTPIPFDPLVRGAGPEVGYTDASAYGTASCENTSNTEADSPVERVRKLTLEFLDELDQALEGLSGERLEQILAIVQSAGQQAVRTVKRYFEKTGAMKP